MSRGPLDTNILSELRRPKPERRVVAFVSEQPLEQLFISAVTFAEIRLGIETVASVTRRAELNDWLTHKKSTCARAESLGLILSGMFVAEATSCHETSCICGSSFAGSTDARARGRTLP